MGAPGQVSKPAGGNVGKANAVPKGAAGAAARRKAKAQKAGTTGGASSASRGDGDGGQSALSQRETLRFYTDDAPGLKIGPTTVLVLSLVFIGIVVLLHVWGKITG